MRRASHVVPPNDIAAHRSHIPGVPTAERLRPNVLASEDTLTEFRSEAKIFAVVPVRDQKGTRCVRLCAPNAAAAPATVSGEPPVDRPLGKLSLRKLVLGR